DRARARRYDLHRHRRLLHRALHRRTEDRTTREPVENLGRAAGRDGRLGPVGRAVGGRDRFERFVAGPALRARPGPRCAEPRRRRAAWRGARGSGAGRRLLRKLAQAARGREGQLPPDPGPRRRVRPGGWAATRGDRGRHACGEHRQLTRSISILGATGSVGASTLDLVRRNRDEWRVVALTANCSARELAALAREFEAEIAVVGDEACLSDLREALAGSSVAAAGGSAALC